ncbi:MAG: Rpn family recombination-promoting nuclease/putative transposase [Chloracidobacterium sp.]|nr:Rpn family recombination-promoting nuclease/putative transposase [Chloracidobacterium sp.]
MFDLSIIPTTVCSKTCSLGMKPPRTFSTNYLPPGIAAALDLSALELVKDSFIDDELREHISDLLYRVNLKRGGGALSYILFEHKSGPDDWVAFQVLRYEVRIWETMRRNGAKNLPLIFPLVFYHGREKWKVARQFSALFPTEDLDQFRKYLPEFEHHLCDFSMYSEMGLKGMALLQAGLATLRNIYSEDPLAAIERFVPLCLQLGEQTAIEYMRTVLLYISKAAERKQSLEQLKEKLSTVESKTEDRIRHLPLEKLEQLIDESFNFTSRDDLSAWLLEDPPNGT